MSDLDRDSTMRDIDARLDAALDALGAEQPPAVSPDDDPDLIELIDTARIIRQLREPAAPDEGFPARLVAGLAADLQPLSGEPGISPNGRSSLVALPTVHRKRRSSAVLLIAALLRALTIAVLAGALAGMIVGGLGSRLAMRVAGTFYRHDHPGQVAITESSGRVVGSFSWGGSVDLLVQGMIFGMLGGIAYLVLRPWLARVGRRWEGPAYGALLLIAAGTAVITSDDADFRRIGLPWLNVLMFGALFVGFGALLAPLERWLQSAVPGMSFRRPLRPRRVVTSLLILVVGGVVLLPLTLFIVSAVVAIGAAFGSAIGLVPGSGDATLSDIAEAALLFLLVVVVPLVRLCRSPLVVSIAGGRGIVVAINGRRATLAVDLALCAVVIVGGITTVVSILRILGLLD